MANACESEGSSADPSPNVANVASGRVPHPLTRKKLEENAENIMYSPNVTLIYHYIIISIYDRDRIYDQRMSMDFNGTPEMVEKKGCHFGFNRLTYLQLVYRLQGPIVSFKASLFFIIRFALSNNPNVFAPVWIHGCRWLLFMGIKHHRWIFRRINMRELPAELQPPKQSKATVRSFIGYLSDCQCTHMDPNLK